MDKDHKDTDKSDSNVEAVDENGCLPVSDPFWNGSDNNQDMDEQGGWPGVKPGDPVGDLEPWPKAPGSKSFEEALADEGALDGWSSNDAPGTHTEQSDDVWKDVPTFDNVQEDGRKTQPQGIKKAFNPWHELDRVSKKNVSRRDLFRGFAKILPKDKDS
jgi:hypothetical protein